MSQYWRNLLFLHWRFPPGVIQETLPSGLFVETYDGSAWVGIVPFQMENVRFLGIPLPGRAHAFPELNLRTYVRDRKGTSGVWFYSLDASSRLAVWGAQSFFHLNYQLAKMAVECKEGQVIFSSRRLGSGNVDPSSGQFSWHLPKANQLQVAEAGSLEEFLVERYALFSRNRRNSLIYRGTLSHEPYRFTAVSEASWTTGLFSLNGLPPPETPPDSMLAAPGFPVQIHGMHRHP
jgi:uncharacterized protein YqjF (DUF2071 family)